MNAEELKTPGSFKRAIDHERNYSPYAHKRVTDMRAYSDGGFCPIGIESPPVKMDLARRNIWYDCCKWRAEEDGFHWHGDVEHSAETIEECKNKLLVEVNARDSWDSVSCSSEELTGDNIAAYTPPGRQ